MSKKTKFLSSLFLIISIATVQNLLTSCTKNTNCLFLYDINSTQIGIDDRYDYYLTAQPLTYTKTKNIDGLKEVCNLSELYKETFDFTSDGFCQSVLMIKNDIILNDYTFVENLVNMIRNSINFCYDNPLDAIKNLSTYLQPGYSSVFNEQNAKKEVFEGCGLNCYRDEDLNKFRQWIKSYLDEWYKIDKTIKTIDSFNNFVPDFNDLKTSSENKYNIICPDGAPSLVFSWLINDETLKNKINCSIINPSIVMPSLKKADIAILPINLATNIYNNDHNWKCFASITNGNLSILSKKFNIKLNKDNLFILLNKSLGVINLSNVPGLTLKMILNKLSIKYVDE